MIEIDVRKSIVSVQEREPLYSGSADVHTCRFTFDGGWKKFTKSAVFRVGDRAITAVIGEDNTCVLPWEVLTRSSIGMEVRVGVYGVSATAEILTSVWDSIGTVHCGSQPGSDAREPSQGVYEQVMASVKRVEERVEEYNESVQTPAQRAESAAGLAKEYADESRIRATSAQRSENAAQEAAERAQESSEQIRAALDAIPEGGTIVINDLSTGGTAAALSAEMGKILAKRTAVNILDNGDFRNVVNQRGLQLYPAGSAEYTIDRWKATSAVQVEVIDGGLRITNTMKSIYSFNQYLSDRWVLQPGKTLTIACETTDGVLYAKAVDVPESGYVRGPYVNGENAIGTRIYAPSAEQPGGHIAIMLAANESVELKWIALYEGAYTVDTLPPYQPKGYAAELAECQRYFRVINSRVANQRAFLMDGYAENATTVVATLELPVAMRALPKVSWNWKPSTPLGRLEASDDFIYTGQAYVQSITAREDTSDLDRLRLDITLEETTLDGTTFSFKKGNRYEFFLDTEETTASARLYLDANL